MSANLQKQLKTFFSKYINHFIPIRNLIHVPPLEYVFALGIMEIAFVIPLWIFPKNSFLFQITLIGFCCMSCLLIEFIVRKGKFPYQALGKRAGWIMYPMVLVVSNCFWAVYQPHIMFFIQTIWILIMLFYNSIRIRSRFFLLFLALNIMIALCISFSLPSTFFDKFVIIFTSIMVLNIAEIQRRAFGEISSENQRRINQVEINYLSEMEVTQREIIFKFSEIAESRSRETGNHVRRVAEYSKILATQAGLEPGKIDLLTAVSPMHDIGKLGIPETILAKPAALTTEERQLMEKHTMIGYDMLKASSRDVFSTAATIALEHHEKFNGEGYPQKKKGDDIHLFSRITAVADVFDALASDRCYKKAWPIEKVLALFHEERGRQFDPVLVDLFFENLDSFIKIRDQWADKPN